MSGAGRINDFLGIACQITYDKIELATQR